MEERKNLGLDLESEPSPPLKKKFDELRREMIADVSCMCNTTCCEQIILSIRGL